MLRFVERAPDCGKAGEADEISDWGKLLQTGEAPDWENRFKTTRYQAAENFCKNRHFFRKVVGLQGLILAEIGRAA